jgi:hypothetical protein
VSLTWRTLVMVADHPVAGVHSGWATGRAAAIGASGPSRALAARSAGLAAGFFATAAAAAPGAPAPMMAPQTVQAAASAAGRQNKNAHPCKHQSLHFDFPFSRGRQTEPTESMALYKSIGRKTGKIQQIVKTQLATPPPISRRRPKGSPFTHSTKAR